MSNSIIQSYYKRNDLNHVEELIMRVTNYAWSEMTLTQQGELREKAAAELAAMQARIDRLEEVARVAGFIELNRHNYLFNGRLEADKASVYYMDLLKQKLDALKGDK